MPLLFFIEFFCLGAILAAGMISMSRRVVGVAAIDAVIEGGIVLPFQGASISGVDALIGADGIFGCVRKYVLGADDPATEPVYAGWWDCRNLQPVEKGREESWRAVFC